MSTNRKVRAKFEVRQITEKGYDKEIKLDAVQETEGDNADFTDATPYGEITIGISKTSEQPVKALDFFKVGETLSVDFIKDAE